MSDSASPSEPPVGELTALLLAASAGDAHAFDRAFTRVYDELHGLARRVRGGRASDTMGATALVHEAYLRLAPAAQPAWEGRRHFLRVAARAMRQVLVGVARERLAVKRGGGGFAVTLDEAAHAAPMRAGDLLALDEALTRLAQLDERQARVVELRFFGGLSVAEVAEALGVSKRTVEGEWTHAKAWLGHEMGGSNAE